MMEQQAESREKDDNKGRFTWKPQNGTGLFFVNMESNSLISSTSTVVSRGVHSSNVYGWAVLA
jgi:hypothetical protein